MLSLPVDEVAQNTHLFANTIIVAANERVVLTEPLDASCPSNRPLLPEVLPHAERIRWALLKACAAPAVQLQDPAQCCQLLLAFFLVQGQPASAKCAAGVRVQLPPSQAGPATQRLPYRKSPGHTELYVLN